MTAQRFTVFLPFTAASATELHDAIDDAFARETAPDSTGYIDAEIAQDGPVLLRLRDVAELLSVSLSSIEELSSRGTLPVLRIGKCVRVRRDELNAWLDALTERQRGGAR